MTKRVNILKFLNNQDGSIIITFAVMINVLVLAIALAMDLGRGYMASSAVSGASDAAAIASAIEGGDAAKAQDYFMANLPIGTLGINYDYNTDVTHTVNTGSVAIDTSGFDVPAFFSAGMNAGSTIDIGGGNEVGLANGAFQPADYFFIIDSSGSMSGSSGSGNSKIQAVEIAINNFLDIVFANQAVGSNGISNYRVSLTNYRTSYDLSNDLSDDKPTILSELAPMLNISNHATCGGCGLRDSKERLIGEALSGAGADRQRIIIFMTDGMLNQHDSAYMANPTPPGFDGQSHGNGAHGMAARECFSMKNLHAHDHIMRSGPSPQAVSGQQNVSIWSIRFGNGANGGQNLALMDYCASDPSQSVWAQTGNDLDQIFSQIGITTSRIRINK